MTKIEDLINSSSLSEEDKEAWIKYASSLSDNLLEHLIYLFNELPDTVTWLNTSLRRKVDALKNNDSQAWTAIVEEERQMINNIKLERAN